MSTIFFSSQKHSNYLESWGFSLRKTRWAVREIHWTKINPLCSLLPPAVVVLARGLRGCRKTPRLTGYDWSTREWYKYDVHICWWLKSGGKHQLIRGSWSLWHYLWRVLYIPGGDRQISEPSTVWLCFKMTGQQDSKATNLWNLQIYLCVVTFI